MSPEAFWDLHGASLYALACALLGDQAAALRAVSLAMADVYSAGGVDAEASPEVTLRTAAACVYIRCHAGLGEIPMERTTTAPPLMVLLGELARGQRAAVALCAFGGHTYQQAATRLNLPPDVVAELLTSGLSDLGALNAGTDTHMVEAWLASPATLDEQAARESAKQEVESLEEFLGHERVSQQRLQEEADKQGANIEKLEAELAELRDNLALR